jgi:hypothetical protein
VEKSGLLAGNMEFNTRNEEWICMCMIICILLPVYFSTYHIQQKYTNNNRKHLFKNAIYNLG